uniref:Cytochrome c oxidase subunit 2 n=1 Tax=Syndesmis echinorum TaxID=2019369 RepID=A0A7G5XUL7_9PLAT|nr:cytochrome c oxidase subunit II [Syndesmis echinorum]QNA49652.1 cytochrome c oxidase subunit 2 [Syndesmis echinorum]
MILRNGPQDSMTMSSQEYLLFHDLGIAVIILVSIIVGGLLIGFSFNALVETETNENKNLEIVWTVVPACILIGLAFPSIKLLYLIDCPSSASNINNVKVVGHQWYWNYQYDAFGVSLNYDSYMVGDDDLLEGDFRLLEVDNPLVISEGVMTQFFVTSADVIHSFAVPALGLKLDAIPGRLNMQAALPLFYGSFYGQCSEICGADHSFMPINIEVGQNLIEG